VMPNRPLALSRRFLHVIMLPWLHAVEADRTREN
jgi:hypothetical protein